MKFKYNDKVRVVQTCKNEDVEKFLAFYGDSEGTVVGYLPVGSIFKVQFRLGCATGYELITLTFHESALEKIQANGKRKNLVKLRQI